MEWRRLLLKRELHLHCPNCRQQRHAGIPQATAVVRDCHFLRREHEDIWERETMRMFTFWTIGIIDFTTLPALLLLHHVAGVALFSLTPSWEAGSG